MHLCRSASRVLSIALLSCVAHAAEVEVFSPQGEVKGVRQVAVRFSEPMVAFGDPRLAQPFDIDCPQPGTSRWADPRNWAYDFEHDLPAGVRCSFRVKEDLRTLGGEPVKAAQFSFTTGGPAILEQLPYRGGQIDEEQVFILALDAHAKDDSILAHAWCDAQGIEEKIAVLLISGEERDQILAARADFVDRTFYTLFKDGRLATLAERDLLRGTRAERLRAAQEGALPLVLLKCARRLPAESPMRLVWGKGVESTSGVATSQDQALEYRVRPAFTANFSCQRASKDGGCLPFLPMQLSFTAPIARASAQKVVLRGPQGKVYKPVLPEPAQGGDWITQLSFAGPFPEQSTFKIEVPADLRDDAQRRLSNQKRFPLTVKTDAAPPLAKFPSEFGILELKAGATLPVTLRNLEPQVVGGVLSVGDLPPVPGGVLRLGNANARTIVGWLRAVREQRGAQWLEGEEGEPGGRVYAAERSILAGEPHVRKINVPKPNGARAFEVVGIPLKQPGFYVVELASPKLGAALLTGSHPKAQGGEVYHVSSAALVTNLAVHFKQGRENALVWVTALDSAAPVANAQVSVQDCAGKEHWKGSTDQRGIARIQLQLPGREQLPGCLDQYDRQYIVFAKAGGDVSFVMSDWDEGIARWRFNLPSGGYEGPYIAATVFDRTLVRAGETVHMKHFYRQKTRNGFRLLNSAQLPREAVIEHQGSEERYKVPVQWDAQNIAEADWQVPREAKSGTYAVTFEDGLLGRKTRRTAGTFRVEEFRVPLMRAVIDPPAGAVVAASSVEVGVQVSYLAGGGAGNAPVKLRSVVQPRSVSFPEYDGFSFLTGAVKEGPQEQRSYDWYRGEYLLSDEEQPPAGAGGPDTKVLKTLSFTLDAAGSARATLSGLPAADVPRQVLAELEYTDPNGEVLTSAARIPLWPAQLIIGLKPDAWALSKDKLRFQALVLDLSGKPAANSPVAVTLFERKTYSHRKRLLGGFYAYESGTEVRRVKTVCEGTTDASGLLLCEFASPVAGEIVVEARTQDRAGNAAVTSSSVWVAGDSDWWFTASNDDRMDVLPERRRYEPGQKAVLQVRMPFRKASALVTVEREGVIDAFVTELSGKSPVVEVPVRPRFAPNAFISVLAVRGRVGDVQPTALVDLGKPAFRMGIAEISVGWKAFELNVSVQPDKPVYRVRDKAKIRVHVRRAVDGKPPPAGTEIAVAAVDEGLLELMPNGSWNLLETMMQRRGIEVDTATASMQVVGKRHYGRKARDAGGGGGRRTSRELFDTLLFWKGRVKLDAQGRSELEIPLNDSLTSFRIVAVANAATGLFGSGRAAIRSTQELMLFSGLPQLVREQDTYRATFTVRNASGDALEASVAARSTPLSGTKRGDTQQHAALTVKLAPGAAQEVGWDVKVPVNADSVAWELEATGRTPAASTVSDRMTLTQKVIEAVPVRTFQATLAQIDRRLELPMQIPGDAIPGRGGVHVALAARLAGELPGVREYMSTYPYVCFEQQVSRAVALRDEGRWSSVMAALPAHLDRDGFAKYFPSMPQGSDVLTTYLLSIAAEAGYVIPDPARARMQSALERFVTGQAVRDPPWRAADLSIRKIAALQALARWGRTVTGNDLASVSIEPNLWPTSAVIDWIDLLKRSPGVEGREAKLQEAGQILRSRLNFQGTTLGFSTERDDYLWWLMISGDVNANRALLAVLDLPQWREDVPRLVRGSMGRQQRGRWNTTVANAWGVLALEKFSKAFEQSAVAGTTRVVLGRQQQSADWTAAQDFGFGFAWPQGAGKLGLTHDGKGKPWATLQSRAAIPLKEAVFTGYRIARSVSAVEQKESGHWSRGDVMRVRLELEAQSDMTWVVVHDSVPAGSTVLGSGLGRDSRILAQDERRQGWVWPAFEERRFDSFRAYYAFVPKGKWTVEYSVRLNNPGEFQMPPTRVEALYAPEMFGEFPNGKVVVRP